MTPAARAAVIINGRTQEWKKGVKKFWLVFFLHHMKIYNLFQSCVKATVKTNLHVHCYVYARLKYHHYHIPMLYIYSSFSPFILLSACWMVHEWYWWKLRLCRYVWGSHHISIPNLFHALPWFSGRNCLSTRLVGGNCHHECFHGLEGIVSKCGFFKIILNEYTLSNSYKFHS